MNNLTATRRHYLSGLLMAFFGAILFSGKAIIIKYLYTTHPIDAISLLSLRMLFSLPFYVIILWLDKTEVKGPLTTKDKWYIVGLGIVGYYLASFFDFKGLEYITATLERLILFTYPTLVVILSYFFYQKQITKRQIAAIIMTYIGILIAFVPDLSMTHQKDITLGIGFIFLSSLAYALYLIGTGEMVKKMGSVRLSSIALIISAIAVLIHYGIFKTSSLIGLDSHIYFWALVMAIFCTVIPIFLVAEGIKRIGSNNASIVGTIGPLSTIVMASSILGEPIHYFHVVGTAVIIAGILIIGKK